MVRSRLGKPIDAAQRFLVIGAKKDDFLYAVVKNKNPGIFFILKNLIYMKYIDFSMRHIGE